MGSKRQLGIVLMVAFVAAFVTWNLQPAVHTSAGTFIRSLVGGLLAGGAALSWLMLVRKRPTRKI